ncbi:unnamed protein product [Leptidea sinapis]|uniref:Coiled-coil domain-containing protein 86 n=1 Tax=Leptidea sinapis TaxID=189913 RepID=A0A5E4PWV5_9NEOP|nr:unnamed protein product [Leptidea sinapis]
MANENETEDKVLSILTNLKQQEQPSESKISKNEKKKPKKSATEVSLRGKPKSGRFWKSKKERFNSINKTKGIRLNFEKKAALRIELQNVKNLSHQLQNQQKEKEEARKEKRRENLKRTEENKRKSEIVQVITNTKKLKRMKKKQLRFIEKRDTSQIINANK